MKGPRTRPVLLALASGGGHFAELARLRPAFSGYDVRFATTTAGMAESLGAVPCDLVPDCNRNTRLAVVHALTKISLLIWRVRPDVLVTTGALPGLIALVIARRFGARTMWIDSVANAEEISLSGQHAVRHADLCLTQWEHLARPGEVQFWGSLL